LLKGLGGILAYDAKAANAKCKIDYDKQTLP
jgi:hypothetical protein